MSEYFQRQAVYADQAEKAKAAGIVQAAAGISIAEAERIAATEKRGLWQRFLDAVFYSKQIRVLKRELELRQQDCVSLMSQASIAKDIQQDYIRCQKIFEDLRRFMVERFPGDVQRAETENLGMVTVAMRVMERMRQR